MRSSVAVDGGGTVRVETDQLFGSRDRVADSPEFARQLTSGRRLPASAEVGDVSLHRNLYRSVGRLAPLGVAFALAIVSGGCPPSDPPPPPPPPPPALSLVPAEYWVEAEGTVKIDSMSVPGRLRMHYTVYPDGRVVVPSLVAWLDDLDLPIQLLWWEVDTEPLRCTQFRNEGALAGTLAGDQLQLPAGAELLGVSYRSKNSKGECTGEARRIDAKTPVAVLATHDPDDDLFSLQASFLADEQGQQYTVTVDVAGSYLNRPPVAVLTVLDDDVDVGPDGCPATRADAKPPIVLANAGNTLELNLRSESHDPDGIWIPDVVPKAKRVDLSFEQWARSEAGGFSFLGEGRELGPVSFAAGQQHQLLLWVTDRRGAEARKVCEFEVIPGG